jgi:two-component system OmpR family sensor kinase
LIRSIRARLLLWLLLALMIIATAGGLLLYRNALEQADAFFDSQLRLVALTLRDQAFEYSYAPPLSRVEPEYDFVVQVWSWSGVRVYLSHPHSELPGITTLGYSTVQTSAGPWRVYGVRAPNYIIQVAQPLSVRSSRAVRMAWQTLRPLTLVVPLLALVIWIAVGRNLRPLERLAAAVRTRSPQELTPVQIDDVPTEVRPLVSALNELLSRLSAVLTRERAFITDAAHELRSPLTALRMQIDNLAHEIRTPSAELDKLTAGVERATRLAEQLLSLARLEPGRFTRTHVRLDELSREVIADLVPLADQRQIDLGLVSRGPVGVEGDVDNLRMLIRNLIDNALRYTPPGGRVDVSVDLHAGQAELRVSDNGPGIPRDEHERVFDRFYRVPGTAVVGSGLGLAIVQTIAQAHDATVTLEEPETGTGLVVIVRFGVIQSA